MNGALLGLLVSAAAWGGASAWRTSGELPPEGGAFAIYGGKFCFDYKRGRNSEAGRFEVEVRGRVIPSQVPAGPLIQTDGAPCYGPCETQGKFYLAVYDDESDHWDAIQNRWAQASCEELLHRASFNISLSNLNGRFNRTVYVHETWKPRFWYFGFVACGITVASPLEYDIHAVNIYQGSESEFGMDELGSLRLHFWAAVLFLLVTLGLRQVAKNATGAEALRSRPLLRLVMLSAMCSTCGSLCLTLHYTVYMFNGWGLGEFEIVGQVWIVAAKASLTVLQILCAKGWALFYAPSEITQRRIAFGVICVIILASIASEIHADFFHDWSTSLYLYQSWPGRVILLLNSFLFAIAWRSMWDTYRHEKSMEVRVFYAMISVASLLYFLTLPVLCSLADSFEAYNRAKYIDRGEVTSRFVATLLLSFCLRPTRLDAMVNARLEAGLDTVGEMRDDSEEDEEEEEDLIEEDVEDQEQATARINRTGGLSLGVRDELPAE